MQVTEAEVKNIVLFFNNCTKGHFIIAIINKGRLLLCQNDAEVFFFYFCVLHRHIFLLFYLTIQLLCSSCHNKSNRISLYLATLLFSSYWEENEMGKY